ncbi:hypothetical protein AUJ77_03460 [Candidatus Nomurabacteria bacterium CG1_02_43_90]|uniref:Uncharacterized protein n=1 Tax=Candidatus Nomurabacteria bacterium CG1_02_43_90 TaxID=1805281 RepID=A0A1J4V4R3_9BACT|nr:MAG: hypothetical protein AUJ77_03460 [Candidatus Nomurabacteria bacterium CG1_02_43_90]
MEEDEQVDTFDYFNTDIKLLALHIVLESFYRGQNIFSLDQFLKGDYWKIEEIADEIRDTNDYGSAEDLVLQQVIQMIKDLNIGKIIRVSVKDISSLAEKIVREAVEEKNGTENEVMMYSAYIDEVYKLKGLKDAQRLDVKDYNTAKWDRVDFTEYDFHRNIQYISQVASAFIEFEVEFDKKGPIEANEAIDDYIDNFSEDQFIEKKPTYRQKRFYFSKQIENFVEYIKRFPLIDGNINIPFSSLSEQDFEVVKVLSYLERQKRLKVRNWNDTELWNVKFHKLPITVASLFGQEDTKETEKIDNEKEIKLNLSFSLQTGTMILTDTNGKEYKIKVQGQVQKEVLRVVFQHPKNTYGEWSLYEISETLGGDDVNEIAVKNAIYQFNKKVKLTIPQVENLFDLTIHSARLDPKYVSVS